MQMAHFFILPYLFQSLPLALDLLALSVERGTVEYLMEQAAWLADDLHLPLFGVPSLAHDIDIHHGPVTHDLHLLVRVHAGSHLHGVRPLWGVTVVWRGSPEHGCRQVGLQVWVVGRSKLGSTEFGVENRSDGTDIGGIAQQFQALQTHIPVAPIQFHGHGHHGCGSMGCLAQELGIDSLKLGIVGG